MRWNKPENMFPSLLSQVLFLPLLQALATANPISGFSWDSATALLAFGDSYTYVEGTYGRVNGSFIGSELDYAFTPEKLNDNKILVNHTSAEGANWVEYLTGCFEGSPAECTGQGQIPLWDFAFGGADVSAKQSVSCSNWTSGGASPSISDSIRPRM